MSLHRFDALSRQCRGCGMAARDLAPRKMECPAGYLDTWLAVEGRTVVATLIVTLDEELVITLSDGLRVAAFPQATMFAARDFIDEEVRRLREAGLSRVWPK